MQIRRLNPKTVALTGMDSFCAEMVSLLPGSIELEDPLVQERLFSSPTAGRESEFEMDWAEYVQPDLRQIFQSAVEIVQGDLKGFPPEENAASPGAGKPPGPRSRKGYQLEIPVRHLDAWIHCLNQSRLALAARYQFTESEMERLVPPTDDSRAICLFQVHFYGFLIESFLQELDPL